MRCQSSAVLFAAMLTVAPASAGGARPVTPDDGGDMAYAERKLQDYLSIWSRQGAITAAAVDRFYAPQVVYYGKSFSRAQVLADKRSYMREWPVRLYREVPGTFAARCNGDRSVCHVSADMTWRRVSRSNVVSTGRARIGFDFVRADGTRKIARESARIL